MTGTPHTCHARDSDGLDYIRRTYGVPARVGGGVLYLGGTLPEHGTVVGASAALLRVRFGDRIALLHPTWNVQYKSVAEAEGGGDGIR